eukprot:PhF_6_TR28343/c0_g1_i1/m.42025
MSSFTELIKQREQQHAQKLQELMNANAALLGRLDFESRERITTEQRLNAMEAEIDSLREAVRQSTQNQKTVLESMENELASTSEHVQALLYEHQHAMHDRLLEQQMTAFEAVNKSINAKLDENRNLCDSAVHYASDATHTVESFRTRVEVMESCVERAVMESEHKLQRILMSQLYITLFKEIGDIFLRQHSFEGEWTHTGESLQLHWDYKVNEALQKLEQTQEHIRSTYPELGDQRVQRMVDELNRAALTVEQIVLANSRKEMGVEDPPIPPEVLHRLTSIESNMSTMADAIDHLRRPNASAWRHEIPLQVEERGVQSEPLLSVSPHVIAGHSRPAKPTEDLPLYLAMVHQGGDGRHPSTSRSSTQQLVENLSKETNRAERTVSETTEWRHNLLIELQKKLGLKDSPWEEILMIDAASTLERLYQRQDELGLQRQQQEIELDNVNSLLGHIQTEFLRLTERETELAQLPQTAEWQDTLAFDSSTDAEGLRQHLAMLHENLATAKQSVYARERTLIDQRNDLWRVLSDLNENISHNQKQIEYYQDILGTEHSLAAKISNRDV